MNVPAISINALLISGSGKTLSLNGNGLTIGSGFIVGGGDGNQITSTTGIVTLGNGGVIYVPAAAISTASNPISIGAILAGTTIDGHG